MTREDEARAWEWAAHVVRLEAQACQVGRSHPQYQWALENVVPVMLRKAQRIRGGEGEQLELRL